MNLLRPKPIAETFLRTLHAEVAQLPTPLQLVGLLANGDRPAQVYARYTQQAAERVGVSFALRELPRLKLEEEIRVVNADPSIHGVMIYYPIFNVAHDNYLKDLVDPQKDIEGLTSYWIDKLYTNDRTDEHGNKAILPCTPLAIVKLLEAAGAMDESGHLTGQTITVFNRSEVVGRPLASMLANDGATVYSFDVHGPLKLSPGGALSETDITRSAALAGSQIVITGVPSRRFDPIDAHELAPETLCVNFSTIRNFTPAAREAARQFIPRVGPMTVAIVLRNAVRLYRSYRL
ncbi:MAG: tetrahydrofolate dehydrogenase/cyclohydrolase catalytic domain-containing protein [Myxococcota bacterium]